MNETKTVPAAGTRPKVPVTVIVNVFNEADTIEREMREIHAEIIQKLPGSELIVAEDGSTDGTKEILERLKGELGIIHSTSPERKGYAKAFRDAVGLARNPYVFFSDTGGKQNFTDFWKLYEHCDRYGIVSGTRAGRRDQLYRRLMTWFYNFLLRRYFRVHLRDADAGFRIYQAPLIRKIAGETWVNRHLISSELALRAIYSGYEVKEVPVLYRQRTGASRGLPPGKIPKVIVGVLRNFSTLKRILTAPEYCGIARPAGSTVSSPGKAG
ncbi:MAG: glycosyltransferase [Verrucomicrobiota bacterium]|jgi:glycosyltransferase involved in cell wall biosynthesis